MNSTDTNIKTVTFRRAYIWQLPVRFFHWINAFALVFLIITGFLIANPPAIMTAKEASRLKGIFPPFTDKKLVFLDEIFFLRFAIFFMIFQFRIMEL